MHHLANAIKLLGEDKLQVYEQELIALLEGLKHWREEVTSDPQRGQSILDGIDRYMHNLGPNPSKQLDQTISKSLEQLQWEETQKYIELSGKDR
jgi:hypothetical protein